MNEREMAQALRALERVVILTHCRPDGDTVGSAAALCLGLRQLGKDARVLENPQLTPKYEEYLAGLTCPAIEDDQTIVAVDIAAEDMFLRGLKLPRPVALAIDHHGTNSGYAENSLVIAERAACGEIIYDVLCEMGAEITLPIANALYVAVSTDTGCFCYSNVNAHTFRVASALMEAGVNAYPINRRMFEVKRFERLRLEAYLTEHLAFFAGNRIGVCAIPLSLKQELGLTEDDVDDLSGFARMIEGVELAVMLREQPSGSVKISVRSGQIYDAGAICKALGGGGHFSAAGAGFRGTIEATTNAVLEAARTLYPDLGE